MPGLPVDESEQEVLPTYSANAPSSEYYTAFDTVTDSSGQHQPVIISSHEGGLRVFAVPDNGPRAEPATANLPLIGALDGLPGTVIAARIIQGSSYNVSLPELHPLLAVILHGPVVARDECAVDEVDELGSPVVARRLSSSRASHSSRPSFGAVTAPGHGPLGKFSRFETTVRVYSLATQTEIALLYRTLPETVEFEKGVLIKPAPIGKLRLDVASDRVVLSSGESGEVFIFSSREENKQLFFGCTGKKWTGIDTANATVPSLVTVDKREPVSVQRPIIAVSDRWIALTFASPTQVSIHGAPLLFDDQKEPNGIHDGPAMLVDTPECALVALPTPFWTVQSERLEKPVARGASLIRSGLDEVRRSIVRPTSRQRSATVAGPDMVREALFPPTLELREAVSLATDVSIFDINQNLRPLASFRAEEGCSFLSFSPGGLRLLAVDRTGNDTSVLELTNILPTSAKQPFVTEVGHFHRSSITTVLDVQWDSVGEIVLVLTVAGTIHVQRVSRNVVSHLVDSSTIALAQPLAKKSTPDDRESNFLKWTNKGLKSVVGSIKSGVARSAPTSLTTKDIQAFLVNYGKTGIQKARTGLWAGFNASWGMLNDLLEAFQHSHDNKIKGIELQPFSADNLVYRMVYPDTPPIRRDPLSKSAKPAANPLFGSRMFTWRPSSSLYGKVLVIDEDSTLKVESLLGCKKLAGPDMLCQRALREKNMGRRWVIPVHSATVGPLAIPAAMFDAAPALSGFWKQPIGHGIKPNSEEIKQLQLMVGMGAVPFSYRNGVYLRDYEATGHSLVLDEPPQIPDDSSTEELQFVLESDGLGDDDNGVTDRSMAVEVVEDDRWDADFDSCTAPVPTRSEVDPFPQRTGEGKKQNNVDNPFVPVDLHSVEGRKTSTERPVVGTAEPSPVGHIPLAVASDREPSPAMLMMSPVKPEPEPEAKDVCTREPDEPFFHEGLIPSPKELIPSPKETAASRNTFSQFDEELLDEPLGFGGASGGEYYDEDLAVNPEGANTEREAPVELGWDEQGSDSQIEALTGSSSPKNTTFSVEDPPVGRRSNIGFLGDFDFSDTGAVAEDFPTHVDEEPELVTDSTSASPENSSDSDPPTSQQFSLEPAVDEEKVHVPKKKKKKSRQKNGRPT